MVEMTGCSTENAGSIGFENLDILHRIMLDIPCNEFHAHLFGGGGDHCIYDAHGMALAEFPQVFARPVSDCQININGCTEVRISLSIKSA